MTDISDPVGTRPRGEVLAEAERLKVRVVPTVVDVEALPPGEYKTTLVHHPDEE